MRYMAITMTPPRLFIIASTVLLASMLITANSVPAGNEVNQDADLSKEIAAAEELLKQDTFSRGVSYTIACGFGHSDRSVELENGIFILETEEKFPSPELAKQEMEKRITGWVKILSQGLKTYKDGRSVGEKVIGVRTSEIKGKKGKEIKSIEFPFIIWTDGQWLFSINAPSLRYAIAYEKHFLR